LVKLCVQPNDTFTGNLKVRYWTRKKIFLSKETKSLANKTFFVANVDYGFRRNPFLCMRKLDCEF
jgi:hypothetical protein